MVLAGFGWFCWWFWVVLGGFGWFRVLVTTVFVTNDTLDGFVQIFVITQLEQKISIEVTDLNRRPLFNNY